MCRHHFPSHRPANCQEDRLYGGPAFQLGSFFSVDGDGWYRNMKMGDDVNPGDSGSGLYFYRNNRPYLYAVAIAEQSCGTSCSDPRPNIARRITPDFFDVINTIVF